MGQVFTEFQTLCRQRGWELSNVSEPQDQGALWSTYTARLDLGAADVLLHITEVDSTKVQVADVLTILQRFNSDFLLARTINAKTSARLRELGVNHGDLLGRLTVHAQNVVLELDKIPAARRVTNRGEEHAGSPPSEGAPPRPVDILSPKSAQLVFALLAWPELLNAPMRKIAATAGVSVGLVPRTLQHLASEGYIDSQRHWTLRGRREIAAAWLASYPSRLRPSLELDFLEGPPPSAVQARDAVTSAGSAVPDLITPSISTLYVSAIRADLIRDNRLRRGPQPNIRIRRRFWEDAAPWNAAASKVAPSLLVYADLLTSDDPREREVAHVYLQKEPELQWL